MVNKFVGSTIYNVIKSVKPNVPKTKIEKKIRDLKLETQKLKGSGKKLSQTAFELKNKLPITFKKSTKKTESNREAYKRIQGENTKVLKGMIDDAFKEKKAKGGRVGLKGGADAGKIPTTPKEKRLAKLAPPTNRITFGDVVAGRKASGKTTARGGGFMAKRAMFYGK